MDLSSIVLPTVGGTTLDLGARPEAPAVLILSNQKTAGAVRELERELHAGAGGAELSVIQVAHLVGVPRVVRKLAERDIRKGVTAQREALLQSRRTRGYAELPLEQLVETVLDWQGVLTSQFGFADDDCTPVVAVLRGDGTAEVVPVSGDIVASVVSMLPG
jgi:hypothetical protein